MTQLRRSGAAFVRAALLLILGLATPGMAGIVSPGDLAKAHATLEGVSNCKKCHGPDEDKFREPCLDCHRDLRERIKAKKGYHAKPVVDDKKDCALCHIDHNGRDFELIRWTDSGGPRDKFDHVQTGYKIDGAHKKLKCQECHKPKFQAPSGGWKNRESLDPERTMLGLPTACEGCHVDVHHKQFADRACTACHTTENWKTASKNFDHSKTKYPLKGLHLDVTCEKCHKKASMDGTDAVIYAPKGGLKFAQCTDCHTNPHRQENRWEKCEDCHDVGKKFGATTITIPKHADTGYGLDGRHASAKCEACHGSTGSYKNRFRELPKDDCAPCHSADTHETPTVRALRAPYTKLSDAGRCDSCHKTDGFTPAHYTLGSHAKTKFPVRDLHAVTPCIECHKSGPIVAGASHQRRPAMVPAKRRIALHPADGTSGDCETCHKNVHLGEFDVTQNAAKCVGCHTTRGWQDVTFDHAKTGFRREGKHATALCSDCHEREAKALTTRRARATAAIPATSPTAVEVRPCQACHFDTHFAQFEKGTAANPKASKRTCEACHGVETFSITTFDHERLGGWPLGVAHEKVACTQCHTPYFADVRRSLRYRGVPRECATCHTNPHKFGPKTSKETP